jgi:hypothetical protein
LGTASREHIGFYIAPSTPNECRPSTKYQHNVAKRLVGGVDGHLYFVPGARAAAPKPSAAVDTAAERRRLVAGVSKQYTHQPRLKFHRRRWLVRKLLFAWASGKRELFDNPAFTLKPTCGDAACQAPGHMTRTRSSRPC